MTAQLIVKCSEFLNKGNNWHLSPNVCEMEAETVAFVVARYLGLDGVYSSNYLALYGADTGAILERLERIRTTAAGIILDVEQGGCNSSDVE